MIDKDKQIKRIMRYKSAKTSEEKGFLQYLEQAGLNDTMSALAEAMGKIKLEAKGEKGDTPVKGKDYFTPQEIADIKREVTPIKGVHYTDGYTPVKGKDYFDGKQGERGITQMVDYNKIYDYVDRMIPEPIPGKDGRDGSPDMAEDIRNKLELLQGDERLHVSFISGIEEMLKAASKAPVVITQPNILDFYANGARVGSGAAVDITGSGVTASFDTGRVVYTITGGGGGGTPSAPLNSIQYNKAGAFYGDSNFERDPTTQELTMLTDFGGGKAGGMFTSQSFAPANGNPIIAFINGEPPVLSGNTTTGVLGIADDTSGNMGTNDPVLVLIQSTNANGNGVQSLYSALNAYGFWGANTATNVSAVYGVNASGSNGSAFVQTDEGGNFFYQDTNNNSYLFIQSGINPSVQFGDLANQGNHFQFILDDNAKNIDLRAPLGQVNIGDVGNQGNQILLTVSDDRQKIGMSGNKVVTAPTLAYAPMFSGGGLNDFTLVDYSGFTYTSTAIYIITIDSIDAQTVNFVYSGGSPTFIIGELVTESFSGNTGTVLKNTGSQLEVGNCTGQFNSFGNLTGSTSGATTSSINPITALHDTFTVDDGFNVVTGIPIYGYPSPTPFPQTIDGGVVIEFGSFHGHTIGTNWTFKINPSSITYGHFFLFDGANNKLQIGDIDNLLGKTLFTVDDNNEAMILNASAYVVMGDYAGNQNGNIFIVADGSQAVFAQINKVAGTFSLQDTNGAEYFSFTPNNGTSIFLMGDIQSQGNGSLFTFDDQHQIATITGASHLFTFDIGNEYFETGDLSTIYNRIYRNGIRLVDNTHGQIGVLALDGAGGDIQLIGNSGTYGVYINDAATQVVIGDFAGVTSNGNNINVNNNGYTTITAPITDIKNKAGTGVAEFNTLNFDVYLADITNTNNGVALFISNASQIIQSNTDNFTFTSQQHSGNTIGTVYYNAGNPQIQFGGLSGLGNGTYFSLDDIAQNFQIINGIIAGNQQGFLIDFTNGLYQIGATGFGNGANFTVDDGNQLITANASQFRVTSQDGYTPIATSSGGQINIGDGFGFNFGTSIKINDLSQLIQVVGTHIQYPGLQVFVNNAAAIAGGLNSQDEYLVFDITTSSYQKQVVV